MSKITYENKAALNQNPNIPDINKVNDTDMNMIKNVVNNNETKVLLAVSSSAPATCDTGDIYFNTTNNLIYTAIATDTWSSTGVSPTENTIYIEFTSQTAYAYDGTTLVSVGGGSGDLIMVYPDTATDNTKLLIEESDLDFQGLEIANTKNNANNMAYSCDYSNKAFGGIIAWTNDSPTSSYTSGNASLSSSDYDMYEIIYKPYYNQSIAMSSGKIPKGMGTSLIFNAGNSTYGPYVYRRDIGYTDATTLLINQASEAYGSTNTINNTACIPIYIIIYKTSLFS